MHGSLIFDPAGEPVGATSLPCAAILPRDMRLEDPHHKLTPLLAALDASFVERTVHVRLALLAILTGHHVVLLGPPGTAKSLLARALCRCFADAVYYEYLLSKFTHPDEMFGPVSIPGLKEEDYRRITDGYLPRAHIAFLDEIFKANSAILNSLLTLVNERVFHHGKRRDAVPLLGLVGASNEPPDPEGGLGALYDRFLVRLAVPPVADPASFLRVSFGELPAFAPVKDLQFSTAEVELLRRQAAEVTADPPVREALVRIREGLAAAKIEASDRRWRWALDLLKMSALTSGRRKLSLIDLTLLEHCFGDPGAHEAVVRKAVRGALTGPIDTTPYLQPLRDGWQALARREVSPDLTTWQRETIAGLQEFEENCGRCQKSLDLQVQQIEEEIKRTPWVSEIPTELLGGLVAVRTRLKAFTGASKARREAVHGHSPAQPLVEEMKTLNMRHHHFYGYSEPVFLIAAQKDLVRAVDVSGSLMPHQELPSRGHPHLVIDDAQVHRLVHESGEYIKALAQEIVRGIKESEAAYMQSRAANPAIRHHNAFEVPTLDAVKRALTALVERLRGLPNVRPPAPPSLDEPKPVTSEEPHARARRR